MNGNPGTTHGLIFNLVNCGVLRCPQNSFQYILKGDLPPGERQCYRTNIRCYNSSAPPRTKALKRSLRHLACYHQSPTLRAPFPQRREPLSLNEFPVGG